MKRFLPTLLVVAVCAAGFWFASSKSFFKEKPADLPKTLFSFNAGDAQQLSVVNESETVALEKGESGWTMSKPSAYPVNSYSADGWVGAFAAFAYDNKVEDNAQDLGQYGLAKPTKQFGIVLKDGTAHKLLVGNPLAVAGSTYVKTDNSPAVYEVSDQSLQTLDKHPLDFMETNALTFHYDKVQSVALDWKGQRWRLDKAQADKTVFESSWKLGDKELKPEEGTAVIDLLTGLSTDQLVKPSAEIKPDSPDLRIEIAEQDGGQAASSTFLGKSEGDAVWIVKQDGAWAYKVPLEKVQALFDKGKP